MRLNLLYGHLLTEGRVRGPGGLAPKTVQNVHRMLHRALARRRQVGPRPAQRRRGRPAATRQPQAALGLDPGAARSLRQTRRGRPLLRAVAAGGHHGSAARRAGRAAPERRRPRARTCVTIRTARRRGRPCPGVRDQDPSRRPLARARSRDTGRAATTSSSPGRRSGSSSARTRQLLFVWPDGRPLHPDTITALFHRHCDAAGLPRIRLHDVRHSYATAALKAGIPPKVISERLGHATAAFTLQTYTHVIPGMDEAAADTVAALILGSSRAADARWTHFGTHRGRERA